MDSFSTPSFPASPGIATPFSRLFRSKLNAVNILIQKMARKGLIKIEKLNSRTVRYILTPRGMKEKTRLTYHFVRRSYHQILSITSAVEKLIEAAHTN